VQITELERPSIRIDREKSSNSEAFFETTVYGKNNAAVLRVLRGNAQNPEEVGNGEQSGNRLVQTWRVVPEDGDKEFEFKVQAMDKRGSSGKSDPLQVNLR
jgi:hypothetical protein